ncbi:MAG: hypothetical protein JNL11_09355 [Bdellovibrionaceae bacterium]|nr:hypothetical protein [Pseudobdellovibrionaceae bacterium]
MPIAIVGILFSILAFSVPKESPEVSAEIKKIEQLARRSTLKVSEWIEYVDDLERRCATAAASSTTHNHTRGLCSLFFDINEVADVFRENPDGPTRDQCDQFFHTATLISSRPSLNQPLKMILDRLCKER